MEKLNRIYAITSVLFLLALLVSPLKTYFMDWRSIQKQYNQKIEKLPQKVKPAPMALQQIWARDLDRIDRCTSCHLGVNDPKLANMEQPLQTHPKIYHDINKFGCTICHQGQGLATNYEDAHFLTRIWDRPVLPNRYVESSCGRCHINTTMKETPNLNRGRQLINDLKCIACHKIPNSKKVYTPSLEGIGAKILARSWLVNWLKNPESILARAKMPDFQLTQSDAEVLADFLISFKSFPNFVRLDSLPTIYLKNKDDDSFIDLGKARFREARCISCHEVEGRGGHLAPDLAKIASKAKAAWIFNFIKNPKRFQPEVEMPQYGFSEKEIAAITAYIESEFIDWDAAEEEMTPHTRSANFYEQGLAIYNRYNCGGCHKLPSEKIAENSGPDLSAMGSKKIYELEFGNTNIPHTLYYYIDAKIKAPRSFNKNNRMPVYQLSDTDRQAITTALLSLRSEPIPLKFVQVESTSPEYKPQGEVGELINKYSCFKCHSMNGSGGDIAPDLSIMGDQLQRNWTKNYFKVPYSLRAIVEERMPNLFISDAEVETWQDYAYTVLLDDSLRISDHWDQSPSALKRGRDLYWEKYGCQSCHIAEGKGGYVGPPLDKVGERLKPGWIFQWLMNPSKYVPKTIEPKTGMSAQEARDMVVYLMSLKKETK